MEAFQKKCEGCGKIFAKFINPETEEVVAIPLFCNDRFCVQCARKRANRARKCLEAVILEEDLHKKKHALKFVTLTVENFPTEKLAQGLKDFNRWTVRLRQRKIWKDNIKGFFYGFEITKARDGRWHLHLHMICEGKFININKLSETWKDIVSKEWRGFIVDIKEIQSLRKAVKEITKYCFKPSSLTDEDKAFLSRLFKNKKLYGFGGAWFKLMQGISYDDLIEKDPFIEEIKKKWVYDGLVSLKEIQENSNWFYNVETGLYHKPKNTS